MIQNLKNIKPYEIIRESDKKVIERLRWNQSAITRKKELERVYGDLKIYKNGVLIS